MARPASGYTNAAGLSVPGTTDIIKRFMNRDRLIYWAFSRGKQGHAKLYDNAALDIGTCVHTMAEQDLKGATPRDIQFYLTASLPDQDQQVKASIAFDAYLAWRESFHVSALAQEISLVSEALQFGGTIDTIARIRDGRGIVDFKTTSKNEVFEDHVLQLAAYGILWEETHPGEPLDQGYHLILLPKEGGAPIHREWTHEQLNPFRQKFWLYRRAYDYDAVCNDPATLQGTAVKPSRAKASKPKTVVPPPRERITVTPRPTTMAEVLRIYGHLRNGATA